MSLVPILLVMGLTACVMDDLSAEKAPEGADPTLGVADLGSADSASDVYRGSLELSQAPLEGTLSRWVPFHTWSLETTAERTFSLEARGTSRRADTVLLLYAVEGSQADLVAYNDDCNPNTLDSCLTQTLTPGLTYLVVVTTFEYAFLGRATNASYQLAATCEDCLACEPSGPEVSYVAEDPDTCAAIRFTCDPGFAPFFNDCGCGCAPADECQIGGCSSQVCHEPGEEVITTCDWRPEYACYHAAACERQADGVCGWTVDDEFETCLEAAAGSDPFGDDEGLCEETGGEWDAMSCGHYTCGEPPLCRAIIPGCDCGPEKNFVEGQGCVEDTACEGAVDGGCEVGGCSSHVCHEAGEVIYTTCEWREEYACYRDATCERQADGACGWTQDDDLRACLGGS